MEILLYLLIRHFCTQSKLKPNCKMTRSLSILMCCINVTFNYYRSYNNWFVWGVWQDHGSLFVVIQTVLFFAFWDNMKYTRFPAKVSVSKSVRFLYFPAAKTATTSNKRAYFLLKTFSPADPLESKDPPKIDFGFSAVYIRGILAINCSTSK